MKQSKSVLPLSSALILRNLLCVIDDITWDTFEYKYTQRVKLMELITQLSLICQKQNDNKEAKEELERLLEKYEDKYGWMHDET